MHFAHICSQMINYYYYLLLFSESIVGATLSIALLTTALHGGLWFGNLLLDHIVELATSGWRTALMHFLLIVGTPLLLATIEPASFLVPSTHLLFEFCALSVSGLVVRENQKSRGARSGSNALAYFQLVVGVVFASLLAVFLLSYLQSAIGFVMRSYCGFFFLSL